MTLMVRSDTTGAAIHRGPVPEGDRFAAFHIPADLGRERSLSQLIESEIIPRLVIAHSHFTPADRRDAAVLPIDIETLAPLSLEVEADALIDHVDAILARGVSVDTVLVDLLAPTARLLGEYWEEDRCDFVEVTMGLWRLQEVVHELAARTPPHRFGAGSGHRALFAPMPGDQHDFGTVVIDEVFRHGGWQTDRMSEAPTADLMRRAAEDWWDVIGLTVSCDCHIAPLGPIIAALRNVSRNPQVCVMVGGRIFNADPALAEQIGADGTARDAKLALELAGTLVRARERETAIFG